MRDIPTTARRLATPRSPMSDRSLEGLIGISMLSDPARRVPRGGEGRKAPFDIAAPRETTDLSCMSKGIGGALAMSRIAEVAVGFVLEAGDAIP
jgi:hypothetical protein